jgi:hypothetical protein
LKNTFQITAGILWTRFGKKNNNFGIFPPYPKEELTMHELINKANQRLNPLWGLNC